MCNFEKASKSDSITRLGQANTSTVNFFGLTLGFNTNDDALLPETKRNVT